MGGKTYDFFLVYAKKNTEQTYQMYVGPGFDPKTGVKLIRADIVNAALCDLPIATAREMQSSHAATVQPSTGTTDILTVTLNLSAFAEDFTSCRQRPLPSEDFLSILEDNKCVGKPGGLGNLTQDERDITCGRAGEDTDCPKGGCVGFSVTLPAVSWPRIRRPQTIQRARERAWRRASRRTTTGTSLRPRSVQGGSCGRLRRR